MLKLEVSGLLTEGGNMSWQRARTDEKKNERRTAICDAAVTLFKKKGYESVSFNGIAAEADFTKSNMYRYYESKEDIFLNIFGDMFKTWQIDYINDLKKLNENTSHREFADTWINSFLKFPDFLELIPLLFTSLEKNSSYNQLYKFKAMSKDLLFQVVMGVRRIYPILDTDRSFLLINSCFAMTSSFWASNFQNEFINKIYEQDDFKFMKPNFKEDLATSIEILLKGFLINDKNLKG